MLCLYEDKLKQYNYILASASPQRINLIKTLIPQLNNIIVQPSTFAEDLDKKLYTPERYVINTSYCKAVDVYNTVYSNRTIQTNTILISADTIVIDTDNNIIEKANNDIDAFNLLKRLQGTTHNVTTAVTLVKQDIINRLTDYKFWDPSDKVRAVVEQQGFIPHDASHKQPAGTLIKQFINTTTVAMCELSDEQIKAYVVTQQYKGKAGAYGIQGLAVCTISGYL